MSTGYRSFYDNSESSTDWKDKLLYIAPILAYATAALIVFLVVKPKESETPVDQAKKKLEQYRIQLIILAFFIVFASIAILGFSTNIAVFRTATFSLLIIGFFNIFYYLL